MNDNKTYYQPGDTVTLKQDIQNKPLMVVKSIDKASRLDSGPELIGVTCMWFNTKMELQSSRFSTKDLRHDKG